MTAYRERFPAGTRVRIASLAELEQFRQNWAFHDPLTLAQLGSAGRETVVKEVGFYHGGEPLYALKDVLGVWHEACLSEL